MPGEGAATAVFLGGVTGGRPEALARRRADSGPAGKRIGAGPGCGAGAIRSWPGCSRRLCCWRSGLPGNGSVPHSLLLQAQYDASSTALNHALALCEEGQVGGGMLRLATVLETAPANAADLKRATRANLVAWSRYSTRLINLLPHGKEVYFVAFSPDGRTALTLSPEPTATLRDAATGEASGQSLRHSGAIIAAAFSPDSRMVVTGGTDGSAKLWEVPSGRPLGKPLSHGGPVRSLAWSADGRQLLTGSNDGTAREWSVKTQQQVGEPIRDFGRVYEVAFGKDSAVALIGGDKGFARLWDLRSHRPIGRTVGFHVVRFGGRMNGPTQFLAWSTDGTRILSNGSGRSGEENGAQLLDATSGQEIARMRHDGNEIRAVALSRDGKVAITGSDDQTARLCDAQTGKTLGPPLRHRARVTAVALSADGKMALTGSEDKTAQIWDIASGKPLGDPLYHAGQVLAVAFCSEQSRDPDRRRRPLRTALDARRAQTNGPAAPRRETGGPGCSVVSIARRQERLHGPR